MEDVIGNAGPGYGYDIIGQQALPVGVPPFGYGFPAGTPYYQGDNHGFGGVHPFAAAQMLRAQQQYQARGPAPDQMAGWGPGGFGPGFAGFDGGCGPGQLVAPLLTQQLQQEPLGLAPRCPSVLQTQYAGFESCNIDPCETVSVKCSPCIAMKIIRMVIPSSIASQIQINQITVNGKWTLVNCGPLPGEMFLPDSNIPNVINTETIQPGCCIEISVTNISGAALYFNMGAIVRVAF